MSESYYDILGVAKNADQKTIKKAYRDLAKIHHPDKEGGDEDKFKKISAAYDTLSDEDKRRAYDNPASRGRGGMGGFSMDDVHDFMRGFRQADRRASPRIDPNIRLHLNITLEEVFEGKEVEINYARLLVCDTCKGEGGDTPIPCTACNGSGHNDRPMGGGHVMRTLCNACSGTGETLKNTCPDCTEGYKETKLDAKVTIPPSSIDGEQVGYEGLGNEVRKGAFGALIIVIKHTRHKTFIMDNNYRFNLIQTLELTYPEMMLGCEKVVSEISGKKLKMKVPPLTRDGDELRMKGKGLKLKYVNNRTGEKTVSEDRGDMFIIPTLIIPESITDEEKALLEQLRDLKEKVS